MEVLLALPKKNALLEKIDVCYRDDTKSMDLLDLNDNSPKIKKAIDKF